MSFANAPANIFELLSEDNEQPKSTQPKPVAAQPVKQQTQQKTSSIFGQPRTENKENRSAAQGGRSNINRGPRNDRPREFSNQEGGNKEQRGPRRDFKDRKPRVEGEQRLDRRSGTGRGPENKRHGGGRGNWGKPTEDDPTTARTEHATAETAVAPETKSAEETTETTTATPAPTTEAPAQEGKAEEKEEEDNTLTLDDFLKQKKPVAGAILPAPRQAGEGIADAEKKKWASIALVKEKSTETKKEQDAPKTKEGAQETGIAINFNTPPVRERRGRDREDRPFKPSGNRGTYNKKSTNSRPPKLDSSAAFPALKA